MRNRASTIVEMLFTLTLLVTTVGATVTLYAFVVARAGDSVTKYNVYRQTNDLLKGISDAASNAISCQSVTLGSVTALKCTMPNSGTDTDGDGIIDIYQPTGVYKTLQEYYSPGKRIWFFPSAKTAAIGTAGNFWYRAIRTDDLNPIVDNIDRNWSYVTSTTPRIYIPGTVTFTHDSTKMTTLTQIAISASSNPNSQVAEFQGDKAINLPLITISRKCYWRGVK